jgi:hypothetical protein
MASCGMIYVLSFMKIGTCVQEILRFCLRNLKGYNVGITDRLNLCSMPSYVTIYVPSFMKTGTGVQEYKGFASEIWKPEMLVLLIDWTYAVRRWDAFVFHHKRTKFHGDLYRLSINIIRFCLGNSKGCNVGITDPLDLYSMPFGCFIRLDICAKFHGDWYRRSRNIKVLPHKSESQ